MIGELAALGAAVSWTISAMLYRKALLEAKPVSANILRLTSTGIILLVFLVVIGKFEILVNLPTNIVVLACLSGIVGLGFGDTFYLASIKQVGVARAVPVTCVYPLFNLVWAALLSGEPVTFEVIIGAVTIVFGIWLLSREKKAENVVQKKTIVKGLAFGLITAILWSVSITMINLAVKETPDLDRALAINTLRVTAVAFSLLASSFLIDKKHGFLKVKRRTAIMLVAGGIVALAIGWFLLAYSFINTLESRSVPISSTTPLFSTLAGIILLRERVTVWNGLGSIIIVFGIFLIFLV